MFLLTIQLLWNVFTTISCVTTMASVVILCMNVVFLWMMVDRKRERSERFFKFDVQFEWKKRSTVYMPFEFYLSLCNYYIVRVSVMNKGFELTIKWYDAVAELYAHSKEDGNVRSLDVKKEDGNKKPQAPSVNDSQINVKPAKTIKDKIMAKSGIVTVVVKEKPKMDKLINLSKMSMDGTNNIIQKDFQVLEKN